MPTSRASRWRVAGRRRCRRTDWNAGRLLALRVLAALVATRLAVAGGLQPGHLPRVLQVVQIVRSDASGQVSAQSINATVRAPGSGAAGLDTGWSPTLDLPIAGDDLVLQPWTHRDTPAQTGRAVEVRGLASGSVASVAGTGAPADTSALLAQAASWYLPQGTQLAARIAARLSSLGLDEAWFNYRQDLPVAGKPRMLIWNLHVNAAGVWFAGTPAFDAPGSRRLAVRYTSRSAAAGLPAGVRWNEAGQLAVRIFDAQGALLAPAIVRDAQGAFDGPRGLACLLGTTQPGCATTQGNMAQWMELYQAGSATLDYVNALQPVYAPGAGGQRYALADLSVDRFLQSPDAGCRAPPLRFTNRFSAAFRVLGRIDHYSQDGAGAWARGSASTEVLTTPLQPWLSLSVAVTPAQLPALPGLVIDPDSGELVSLAAFPAGIQTMQAQRIVCLGPA